MCIYIYKYILYICVYIYICIYNVIYIHMHKHVYFFLSIYIYILIWLLSHPPACPYHFPCPGSNGKAKMHQLYCQWLSCKGQWEKCALVISFKKQHVKDSEELYQFLPRSAIVKEYGEDLADDLIARHKAAEAKLPANQKNQFIKPSLISKYIVFYCSICFCQYLQGEHATSQV